MSDHNTQKTWKPKPLTLHSQSNSLWDKQNSVVVEMQPFEYADNISIDLKNMWMVYILI